MTRSISQRLREAAESLSTERVSVATLADAHGPALHGSLLLLMAVPSLLPVPGAGTVMGLGIAALALAMLQGRDDAPLPRRVAELEMSQHWARRVLGLMATIYGLAERWSCERLAHLAPVRPTAWLALVLAVMAAILVLPIPFGNILPALAVATIGLGLAFRDGLVVVVGTVMAGLTLLLTSAALFALATQLQVWVVDWMS
ncbi:exopolysaccharide biosynthesis protein [Leptothrix sp. BB-4]